MPFPETLPLWDAPYGPVVYDFDVENEAIDRLIQQYKTPKTEALVGACAAPAQDLEDAINEVYTLRWIGTAFGVQLDVIGEIVGLARNGLDDNTYKIYLQAQVLVNRSSGCPEELYAIFLPLLPAGGTLAITYEYPASFILTVGGAALDNVTAGIFNNMLQRAKAAGIGAQLVWSVNPPSGTLGFDDAAHGFDDAGAGLGEAIGT